MNASVSYLFVKGKSIDFLSQIWVFLVQSTTFCPETNRYIALSTNPACAMGRSLYLWRRGLGRLRRQICRNIGQWRTLFWSSSFFLWFADHTQSLLTTVEFVCVASKWLFNLICCAEWISLPVLLTRFDTGHCHRISKERAGHSALKVDM